MVLRFKSRQYTTVRLMVFLTPFISSIEELYAKRRDVFTVS
jgi:hypothetical protein